MVERGQVLERMVTFAGPQGLLEGLWQTGGLSNDKDGEKSVPVLFCPPHPRLGGSMDSPVCAELVWVLGHRRHPTLRFNWSGVSASQGASHLPPLPAEKPLSRAELQPLVDDALAALDHLRASTGARDVLVVGVSVGALVAALIAGHEAVAKVALVAPPLDVADFDIAGLEDTGVSVRVYVGDCDTFAPLERLRARVPHPVVVANANHTFSRGLPQLAAAVLDQLSD